MRRERITTIVSTSPIPSMPRVNHISRTIDSLAHVPELAESSILIVCDGLQCELERDSYAKYVNNIVATYRGRRNVHVVTLDEWGHLSGVLQRALANVRTEFVFIQQHDLPIIRPFDLGQVLTCLAHRGPVRHVRLNRRVNEPVGWDKSSLFQGCEIYGLPLTRTSCWSDQSHVCTTEYYRSVVVPVITGKKEFPENLLNPYRKIAADVLLNIHRKLGTYIYGGPGHPAIITHTDARNDA